MGLFGGGNTSSATTNNAYDQRSVIDASGGGINAGALAKVSTSYADSRSYVDQSNDSGVVIGLASELGASVRTQSAQGTDAVRALAGMGSDVLNRAGASVSDMYAQAGSNAATAWGHTLDVSGDALTKAFSTTDKTLQTAAGLAQSAMSAYQPADAKMADAMKYAAIAGAVLVGFALLRGMKG